MNSRTRRPPVRALHLGLGNFFRAHQCVYTQDSDPQWGIAAFTGSRPDAAVKLQQQDCVYTLDVRSADGDAYELCESLVAAHAAADHDSWTGYWADPAVEYLTITVTEAGYRRAGGGGLDFDDPAVRADLGSQTPRTAPGRIVAGLQARRRADAGPMTLIPCDNLPGNGAVLRRVLTELAERLDPGLSQWMEESIGYVSTAVDRITPATTAADLARVAAATGVHDEMPVITEPYSEWVLSDTFVTARPAWETAGAVITEDVSPYEARKLTLLNGAHSLMAYLGSLRGRSTIAEAIADPTCRAGVERWWAEAGPHLPLSQLAAYEEALLQRFANPGIQHGLAQVAMDGSQKLPVRILPTIRAERAAGRVAEAAALMLAAWIRYLKNDPAPDPQRPRLLELADQPLDRAVPALLAVIDEELPDYPEFVEAVITHATRL